MVRNGRMDRQIVLRKSTAATWSLSSTGLLRRFRESDKLRVLRFYEASTHFNSIQKIQNVQWTHRLCSSGIFSPLRLKSVQRVIVLYVTYWVMIVSLQLGAGKTKHKMDKDMLVLCKSQHDTFCAGQRNLPKSKALQDASWSVLLTLHSDIRRHGGCVVRILWNL